MKLFLIASFLFLYSLSLLFVCDAAFKESQSSLRECIQIPEIQEDRRKDKGSLSIATYNVEFLFKKGKGTLKCPGEDCKWKTQSDVVMHVQKIASTVYETNADIVQLTEIEDCDMLEDLVQEISKLGDNSYKAYMILGKDQYTGQNVGLITRIDPSTSVKRTNELQPYPIQNSTCGTFEGKERKKSVSKNFYTEFKVQGFKKPITLVGLHFLARPTDPKRCFEREAQAKVIGEVAKSAVDKGNDLIVLGDYNDYSDIVSDSLGHKPISSVLSIIRESGNGLKNVASYLKKPDRISSWWDRKKDCEFDRSKEASMIDHVLVSPSLHERIYEVESFHERYNVSCKDYRSDHFPIVARIDAERQSQNDQDQKESE